MLGFQGSVILVSHDRYFLDRVCDRIIAFEGDGYVHVSEGNYSYYVTKREERERAWKAQAASAKSTKKRSGERPPKLTWKEERELGAMEETILEAEGVVESLQEQLNDPNFYVEGAGNLAKVTADLEAKRVEAAGLYVRWEALEEKRKAFEAAKSS